MMIQILTFYVIASFSPYLLVEKSFLTSNSVDTLYFPQVTVPVRVISETADAVAVGLTAEKSPFLATISLGIPWCERIEFIPYLDINAGTKWRNLCGYGGLLISSDDRSGIKGLNSIYIGVKSIHRVKKFRMGFDIQLKRENISTAVGDTTYFNSVISSEVGYNLRNLNPFLFLSLEKKSISRAFSLKAGLGISFGSMLFAKCKAQKIIHYPIVIPRKPNIYLYPTKPCSVKVILEPNGRILVSNPPYRGSWNVKAFPNGFIQDTPGYLFYEAKVRDLNVKRKGWCISAKEIASFFYRVLAEYGFNEKETEDFISYWRDRLPLSPYYAIYSVINEEIESICPLEVYPTPEQILRVWFVVVPKTQPISLERPRILPFRRDGFVVTEWGVIMEIKDGN